MPRQSRLPKFPFPMRNMTQFAAQFRKEPPMTHVLCGIFEACGRLEVVDERMMDAVGCVSGCSPAYVYMFIEALADGAVKYGLPRAKAYQMAAQTVLGSAKMVLETGKHPGQLKDEVCSPGGTTIAGVSALEEWGFRNAVIKAEDASYEKGKKM